MFPLSVIRLRLEAIPGLAGCTKQKLPTTSTTQNSLSPVAASMIFSMAGTSISVVYLTLAWIGTMSCEWTWTVRAAGSCARAMHVAIASKAAQRNGRFKRRLLRVWSWRYRQPCVAGKENRGQGGADLQVCQTEQSIHA